MKRRNPPQQQPPKPKAPPATTWELEAEVVPGLDDLAATELGRICTNVRQERPGVLRCRYSGQLNRLRGLRLVVAVYVLRYFAVPRPKALLGHQHFTAMLDTIKVIRQGGEFRSMRISAAGEESAVLARLRDELSAQTGLKPAEEGDLLLRLRRAGEGWELLARTTPRPLSARPWRVCNMPGALNATVAAAMNDLTRPQPDDVFLNLASGSGTFLIERLNRGKARLAFGIDTNPEAIACARRNIDAANVGAELLSADITRLPLADSSVDVLVADLPFGRLISSHSENVTLYPALLAEAARVAKPGARMALISHEIRLLEESIAASPRWTVAEKRRITLPFKAGGINPVVYLLRVKG